MKSLKKFDFAIWHRIVLITNQSEKLNLNTASYPCSVGNVIILFENETYFFEGEVGFQYMYIDFKGLRSYELFRRFGINESNRIFSGLDGLIPLWDGKPFASLKRKY